MITRDDASVFDEDAPIEGLFTVIAERLTVWQTTSNDALGAAVILFGACLDDVGVGDPPGWLFDDTTDRELGAMTCADCPISDACLELELRLLGAARLGMWGPLGEDGRRALHPIWVKAREGTDGPAGGGEQR